MDAPSFSMPSGLQFPDGLVGLPGLVRFALEPIDETVFVELVSLDDPTFRFAAAAADDVRPGITADLADRGLVAQGAGVLVFLAVHGDPPGVTANLAGPLVVAPDGVGRQLVLEDPDYPLRQPLAAVG